MNEAEIRDLKKDLTSYIEKLVGKSPGPKPKEKWHSAGPEFYFNPMENIERTKIPILAFFGENDKQADPVQGVEAYQKAIKLGGNILSRVILVPGVDHVLVFSSTGCIQEWQMRTAEGWGNHSPIYLDTMEEWLKKNNKSEQR